MTNPLFTNEAILRARQAAAKGELPSLETVRLFIQATRKSWLAKPAETKPKENSRMKKPPPVSEDQLDFF